MTLNVPQGPINPNPTASTLRGFLAWAVGLGTCLVILMATMAFGPSGFGFAVVIALFVFGLMGKRYRFSLRTFLILTTLLGVWLGLKVSYDRKLQQAISTLTNAGGRVVVQDRSPNFPWGIWADNYNVDFYNLQKQLTVEQFSCLVRFSPSSIRNLYLNNTGITDDELRFIRGLKSVQILDLANEVYFGGKPIPDRAQNHISDEGIQQLRGLKSLIGIELDGTAITDKCVDYLIELPNLRWINLNGTQVTGAGLSRLSSLRDLVILELNGCPISHEGVNELSRLTNVRCVGLNNSGITDADLDVLNTMPQIGTVRIAKKDVSQEAVKRFSHAHPNCRIEWR